MTTDDVCPRPLLEVALDEAGGVRVRFWVWASEQTGVLENRVGALLGEVTRVIGSKLQVLACATGQ